MEKSEKLWKSYSKNKDQESRDELIVMYMPLVKYIASRVNLQVGQYVEMDDLVSYGIFGLIDAIDKFEYDKGNKFETYASLRIRGAIIDSIRKLDWVPRSVRNKNKQVEQVYAELEQKLGRQPTDDELAKELDISKEELDDVLKKSNITALVSLDAEVTSETSETFNNVVTRSEIGIPEKEYHDSEVHDTLVEALECLNEKEKMVISLYYYDELALKEIAQVLNVSDSRISQIHSKALLKLRSKLGPNQQLLFNI